MSSSTTPSITITNAKTEHLKSAKKSKSKLSKEEKKKEAKCEGGDQYSFLPDKSNMTSTFNPFSTCGPLQFENEFLRFYAELYRSAVLFSDPKYQQELLFPIPTVVAATVTPKNLKVPSSPQGASRISPTSSLNKKRHMKKAQRRLSADAFQKRITDLSSVGSTSGSGSGSGGGSGSMKHLKNDFEQFFKSIATSTPILQQKKKGKIPGLKRKVSFSNSPRMRSRSNSNQQQAHGPCIDEQDCWSSDMDETDTTEDEDEDNASSTLGEGDDVVCSWRSEPVNTDKPDLELETQFSGLSTETGENAKTSPTSTNSTLILNDN